MIYKKYYARSCHLILSNRNCGFYHCCISAWWLFDISTIFIWESMTRWIWKLALCWHDGGSIEQATISVTYYVSRRLYHKHILAIFVGAGVPAAQQRYSVFNKILYKSHWLKIVRAAEYLFKQKPILVHSNWYTFHHERCAAFNNRISIFNSRKESI